MNKNSSQNGEPRIHAVMHRAGGSWRAIIAKANGGHPRVVEAREFSNAEVRHADQWFDRHQVELVHVVLPGSAVICRTCVLPDAELAQLTAALDLQAEAHIAPLAPPHRVGAAVLHAAPDESTRAGLMIAWPEAAAFELPEISRPIHLTPDVAALAALLNGQRPSDPLIWLDRNDGSLSFALTHTNGAAFRCTQADTESPEGWQRNVGRVLTETGLRVGHTEGFLHNVVSHTNDRIEGLNGTAAALFLPGELLPDLKSRIEVPDADESWWEQYGVATGALLAHLGQLEPLTRLEADTPIETPTLLGRLSTALSRPNVAVGLVCLGFLLLLFGPLAHHGLRLGLQTLRFDDLDKQLQAVEDIRARQEMYQALGKNAWPMTKLLADLASCTPVGIELDTIRINYNDSLSITGRAMPSGDLAATEVIDLMRENLDREFIFHDTMFSWDDPTNFGQYEFTLGTRIDRAFRRARYGQDQDFAAWTMQMRVDGVLPSGDHDASVAAAAAPLTTPSGGDSIALAPNGQPAIQEAGDESYTPQVAATDPNPNSRSGRRGGTGSGAGTSRDRFRDTDVGLPISQDIPEPITEGQIAAMSLQEVQTALGHVSKARRLNSLDEETAARLKKEFGWLINGVREKRKK